MTRDQLLTQCLQELEEGASAGDLAQRYPSARTELQQLASLQQKLEDLPRDIVLSDSTRTRLRSRVMDQVHADVAVHRVRRPGFWESLAALLTPSGLASGLVRPISVGAAVCLLFSVAGVRTVSAAWDSLPGDDLYPVKTAIEQARVALATNDNDRAQAYVDMASNRVDELQRATDQGRIDAVPKVAEAYTMSVGQALSLAAQSKDETKVQLQTVQSQLQQVFNKAPASVQTLFPIELSPSSGTTSPTVTITAAPASQTQGSTVPQRPSAPADIAPEEPPAGVGPSVSDPLSEPAGVSALPSLSPPITNKGLPVTPDPASTKADPVSPAPVVTPPASDVPQKDGAIGAATNPVPSRDGAAGPSAGEPAKNPAPVVAPAPAATSTPTPTATPSITPSPSPSPSPDPKQPTATSTPEKDPILSDPSSTGIPGNKGAFGVQGIDTKNNPTSGGIPTR